MKKLTIGNCVCYLTEETYNKVLSDIEETRGLAEYERELDDFFHTRIACHTEKEYQFGNALASVLYNAGMSPYDDDSQTVPYLVALFPVLDCETAKSLLRLVCDCDYYSDWHKDIYGFRPRYTLK